MYCSFTPVLLTKAKFHVLINARMTNLDVLTTFPTTVNFCTTDKIFARYEPLLEYKLQ